MKRPAPTRTHGPGAGFPFNVLRRAGRSAATDEVETPLDPLTIKDILGMTTDVPAIRVSLSNVVAEVLPGPFSFHIPALGIESGEDMRHILENHHEPFAINVWLCCKQIGVAPFFMLNKGGHRIPVLCDLTQGYVAVCVNTKTRKTSYKWYDAYQDTPMADSAKDIYWFVTRDAPAGDGTIRSAMASLLPTYRSLLKMRQAQDIVNTQRPRPVHIVEMRPDPRAGQDDNLIHMASEYGRAAGISKERLDESREAEKRMRASQLKAALRETQQRNLQQSTAQPTLYTDTPAALLDEMNAGFTDRVVVLRERATYREAAKPDMVGDYIKASKEFDVMAAAVMDSNVEFFTPTGGSNARAHQGEMIDRFTNGRIRQVARFFQRVLQCALVIAYKTQFQQVMNGAYQWRLAKGEDASQIVVLHPELDVEVRMPKSSVLNIPQMQVMRDQGLIEQKTMAEYIAQAANMPIEDLATLEWPDNVPRERLVKPQKEGDVGKPPKKKSAKTNV